MIDSSGAYYEVSPDQLTSKPMSTASRQNEPRQLAQAQISLNDCLACRCVSFQPSMILMSSNLLLTMYWSLLIQKWLYHLCRVCAHHPPVPHGGSQLPQRERKSIIRFPAWSWTYFSFFNIFISIFIHVLLSVIPASIQDPSCLDRTSVTCITCDSGFCVSIKGRQLYRERQCDTTSSVLWASGVLYGDPWICACLRYHVRKACRLEGACQGIWRAEKSKSETGHGRSSKRRGDRRTTHAG